MNVFTRSCRGALLALAMSLFVHALPGASTDARAQAEQAKPESLRPAIATPLAAAQESIKARNYAEALAKVRDAEAVPDRTPYENFVIEQTRAAAAAGAGDATLILKSSEALVATGRLPAAEQIRMMEAITNTYYKRENYEKAIEWASRYLKESGNDPQMRLLLTRSYYFSEDYKSAAPMLRADLDADEKAGRTPTRERVQMLASSYLKLNDAAGYMFGLEKMLAYYPRKDYWADAIRRVQTKPGFSERLDLDALRLLNATGNLTTAAQHTAMAQLSLRAGLPAEAKKIIDQGFASGVLGAGSDADQQRKLRDNAAKQVAEDEVGLAKSARDAAAAKDGNPIFNVGFAYVAAGQFDKGIPLMEQGMQKGGLKRPDDARLHLGVAYLGAGQKSKALDAFKSVQGADGAADLARLWAIHAQQPSS